MPLSGLKCHNIHTQFHKRLFIHPKVNRRGFTDTQTAWRTISLLSVFENNEIPGYISRGPGSIPGATRFFLRSSGSGTGSTQPREDN
jgi:hypothetical protein